jgi:flavoprotein
MNLIRIRDVKDRIYAAFGSYAWAPAALKRLHPFAEEMKWEAVGEGFELKMADLPSVIGAAWDLGTQMAERLKA